MKQPYLSRIDAYAHIIPLKYMESLKKLAPEICAYKVTSHPALWDMKRRFQIMDRYPEVAQVVTLGWPAIEEAAKPDQSPKLAREANDGLAELASTYPDRFIAAIAALPMNNMDAALEEVDRAIIKLRCRGVLVYSNINGKPLDLPEFMPLYEKMAKYNLPIYIHPRRDADFPDYQTESESKYGIANIFGWPYDTTAAMTRLVFSGVFEKYPNLKVITHHCGGMVPYFKQRIVQHVDSAEMSRRQPYTEGFTRPIIEYFQMFYNDTAIHGNTPGLMCAYAFCGADHLLFGADMPLGDRQSGYRSYRQTINAIEAMDISDVEKKKIFEDNISKILRLTTEIHQTKD